MRIKSARMSCAKGATVIKLSAAAVAVVCASSALFWLISPVRVLSAAANSGPPWEEGVTADGIYSLHEDSVLEVQSEVLTFDISSLPSDIAEGRSYDARVTAEYTFYNPTDEYVTTAMAFPFGIRSYYAEELDVAQISDPIKINGKTADYEIRHTYGKYGEFESVMSDAILSGLLGEAAPAKNKVCKVCGMRFEEYERTGLLGCSSCYDVFKDELMPSIERIQGKTRHVGKEGGDHSAEHDLRLRLKALQEQLEAALTRGDYPSASRLNRQMTAIKNAMNGGANG